MPEPAAQETTRAPLTRRILLAATATAFALVAVEIGFRVRAHLSNAGVLEVALRRPPNPAPEQHADLVDIIQPSTNPRIVFELRPELDRVQFKRHPVSTNSQGFRSRELPAEREDDTLVIFGIGDSLMFGHGVGNDETYLAVLEEGLRHQYPDRDWRVVNTGVPGYNTVMEVATLREKGLPLEPDLVVLHLVGNDYALPNYFRDEVDPWDPSRSFAMEYVRDALASRRTRSAGDGLMHKSEWDTRYGRDPETIPERYRELTGEDAFDAALDELAALSEEHGFPVIAFNTVNLELLPRLLRKSERRGFHTFTLHGEIEAHLREEAGVDQFTRKAYTHSQLVVNRNNLHPSVIQHRMIARRLFEEIKTLGVFADALEK